MKFSELDGKSIVLWGLGRETGALRTQLERRLPAARIAAVVDDRTAAADAQAAIRAADVLVRSPGVSIYKPLIREALAQGVAVATATGLWLAERRGRHVIGVTGTKGKSTTATVIAHVLSAVMPTELAGNIGRPVIELLDLAHDEATWVVLELSSYQLADLTTGPEVAVLTNLYREHTDWHGSEAQYRADKLRIFGLPGVRSAVYPLGDRQLETAAAAVPARAAFADPAGWHVDAHGAVRHGGEIILTAAQIPLRGRHNAENVATGLAAIAAAGLPLPADLAQTLATLKPLPHRLQTVHTAPGNVEWVDDSISTTPESTIAALEAFTGRHIILIAGGQDRGQDHDGLGSRIAQRAAETTLIALPDTGPALAAAARAHGHPEERMSTAGDMREATARAAEIATARAAEIATARAARAATGGATQRATASPVILLSPAAPSYNAYDDFEQRGDDFAACARRAAPAIT